MKAADLAPQERRLLRHMGRIDPNPCVTVPGEWETARRLVVAGLAEQIGGPNSPRHRITEKGRGAL